jgi:hypothetical protein
MYSLISAVGRPIQNQGRWEAASIGDMPMTAIFATYERVLATLSHPYLDHNVCLDLDNIRSQYGSKAMTFNQVLTAIGSMTLPTTDTLPVLKTKYARYMDAFRAGYKIQPVHPTAAPDAQIPEAEKTWLHLTRDNTDYQLFYQSCLISVNGFIHATDYSTQGVWVQDGMKSRNLSRRNNIGIHSFNGVSKLSFVPIKPEMVYKQDPDQDYSDRMHIDIGIDISQKAVLLVLGGYLYTPDPRTFYRISDTAFAINFANVPYIDRYFDSKHFIDLSSMSIDASTVNPNLVAVAQLLSDEALVKYATLSQSFFVVLDNPEIFIEHEYIHTSKMPGMYISYVEPKYPLLTELGKVANYWYSYEDGQFSIVTTDADRENPIYRTVEARLAKSLSNSRNPVCPSQNSELRYLKIGADLTA